MAEIVLGLGSSHSPQLGVPASQWQVMRQKDENDKRMDYPALVQRMRESGRDIEKELTPETMQKRDDACQRAIGVLSDVLRECSPDVMLVFGDDQHEQFLDDNMPMLCVYHGESIAVGRRGNRERAGDSGMFGNFNWRQAEGGRDLIGHEPCEYAAYPRLGEHLVRFLCDEGFDVARSNQLKAEIGVGHAFSFIYRRLLPDGDIPMVPFMINTFYPPNTPTPSRCYALGQAVRRAVESWESDARVAVIASGGLSHVIIDEDLDRRTIDGLMEKDAESLSTLPTEKLMLGTSEIRNWIIAGGALEPMQMTLLDYVPTYRSPAGTGCGMTFAYWK